MAMAPVVLVVIMGVLRPRDEKKIKKDLMKIDGTYTRACESNSVD